jgi:hypothetical protein
MTLTLEPEQTEFGCWCSRRESGSFAPAPKGLRFPQQLYSVEAGY